MIGFTFTHPEFLGLLLLLPIVIWAWRRWPPPLSPTRGWVVLVSRVLLITLLALALSGIRLTTPLSRTSRPSPTRRTPTSRGRYGLRPGCCPTVMRGSSF